MTEQEWREELMTKVNSIHQGLYGVPGTDDKGLCGEVKRLAEEQSKLKRYFWTLVGVLVGSGVIGAGIWGAFG